MDLLLMLNLRPIFSSKPFYAVIQKKGLPSIFCAVFLIIFTACTTHTKNIAHLKQYQQAVANWTSSEKLYDNLETILIVDALYQNFDVRKSSVYQYARMHSLSEDEKEKLIQIEKKEDDEIYRFIISVYASNDLWYDFEKKDSIWKVRLKDSQGTQKAPEKIKRIKQRDIKLKRLYPFISPWKKVYEVDFKRGRNEEVWPVKLMISSMIGSMSLTWEKK